MDWDLAIDHNREALLRIVAALFALAGLTNGEVVATLPRRLHRAVLLVLRPAESAVRRLVVIAARGIVPDPCRPPRGNGKGRASKAGKAGASRPVTVSLGLAGVSGPVAAVPSIEVADPTAAPIPAFKLFDPLKRFDFQRRHYAATHPRVSSLSAWSTPVYLRRPGPPAKPEPSPNDAVGAARLCRRMIALRRALDDLPEQAMRLARWRARRAAGHGTGRMSPMRPGWPPGRRKRHIHEIDAILSECHGLAVHALERADTS